jgi:acetyltransferase-like isoleucine patch superfamily enzyme
MRLGKSFRAYVKNLMGTGRSAVAGGHNKVRLGEGSILSAEAVIDNIRGKAEFITIGRKSFCRGRLLTYGHGGRISIGDWCYIGARTEIWSMDSIEIGDRVLISHDVNIHDGTAHSIEPTERHAHFRHIIEKGHPTEARNIPGVHSSPVVIEDDAWISFGVTILRGVHIGAGSVIAARSIVTEDVPSGVIYRNEIKPIIQTLPTQRPAS